MENSGSILEWEEREKKKNITLGELSLDCTIWTSRLVSNPSRLGAKTQCTVRIRSTIRENILR